VVTVTFIGERGEKNNIRIERKDISDGSHGEGAKTRISTGEAEEAQKALISASASCS